MEAKKVSSEKAAGVPDRLFDGYDGDGPGYPDAAFEKLMASAPEAVRKRAAEYAAERAKEEPAV